MRDVPLLPVAVGQYRRVHVQRHPYRGVSESFLDDFGMGAGPQHGSRVRVAKLADCDPR